MSVVELATRSKNSWVWMPNDYLTSENLRDASHPFKAKGETNCVVCNRPRWAHVYDGHVTRPEHKYSLADTKYRPGPHPYWTRPGQFNKKEVKRTSYGPSDQLLSKTGARPARAGINPHPQKSGERPCRTVPFRNEESNHAPEPQHSAPAARTDQ